MKDSRIKLTKAQHNKLLNQHIGTGFVCYKESDNTTVLIEFYTDKEGRMRTMRDAPLDIDANLRQVVIDEYTNDAINGE